MIEAIIYEIKHHHQPFLKKNCSLEVWWNTTTKLNSDLAILYSPDPHIAPLSKIK